MDKYQQFADAIKESGRIVFFTGAGMSTESGIPDFRSNDGLYKGKDYPIGYRAEEILSADFFNRYPRLFFDYYFKHLIYPQAQPNVGHEFIAQLEDTKKDITVVTQNIDGLHQLAGSANVLELHGTVLDNYCLICGRYYSVEELNRDEDGIPRCVDDNGIVRPRVVLYQEGLPMETLDYAIEQIRKADLLVVLGTSLIVYPAAGLVNYFNGSQLVLINKTPIATLPANTLVFQDSINHVFNKVQELM